MTTPPTVPALDFTGERFTPECVREIWYEHWARYAFALEFAQGKRVLDAACGEGFGSALLARTAREVTGVDISAQAVAHAQARYGGTANLRYLRTRRARRAKPPRTSRAPTRSNA